jgi:hypothetical protein
MLFEDTGLLTEDRRLPTPDFKLADRDLEIVLRVRSRNRERNRSDEHDRACPSGGGVPIHLFLRWGLRDGVLRELLTLAGAAGRRGLDVAPARGGSPPALPRRSVQYSQVRFVTFGSALSEPASLISPAVKVVTSPISLALS